MKLANNSLLTITAREASQRPGLDEAFIRIDRTAKTALLGMSFSELQTLLISLRLGARTWPDSRATKSLKLFNRLIHNLNGEIESGLA